MSFRWRYENADGRPLEAEGAPESPAFPSQGDAESWVGEEWQGLLEQGVDQVTLLEDAGIVYGPMSLHPAL